MRSGDETALRLDDFLPYRLSVASNAVSEAIARAYRRLFGLKVAEWRIVAVLAEAPMRQRSIAERTRMDKVTVTRAVQALEKRGLVEARASATDRRARDLELTAEGRELYAQVAPRALEFEARIFAGFAADERAALRAALERIEAAASAAGAGHTPDT